MAYVALIDASANPNYPSASANAYYLVSIEGRVGGVNGKTVNAGDLVTCTRSNSGGTEAAVGADWSVTAATEFTKMAADISRISGVPVIAGSLIATTGTVTTLGSTTATATTLTSTNATATNLTIGATRAGVATIPALATEIVVATTAAAATSAIIVTPRVSCAVTPMFVSDIVAATSFKINGDPGDYAWAIITPAT
jgi:hypothetical protein